MWTLHQATILYFSVSTQTLVGLGAVAPNGVFAQVLATIQMVVGSLFQLYLIAHTIPAFRAAEQPKEGLFHRVNRCLPKAVARVRRFFRTYLLIFTILLQAGCVHLVLAMPLRSPPRASTHNLLCLSLATTSSNSLLVFAAKGSILVVTSAPLTGDDRSLVAVSICLQVLQVLLILVVSLKFLRKAYVPASPLV